MCPNWTAPAHDPASVVGHGDRKGRKDEYRHRGRVTSRKTKRQGPTRTGLRCVLTLAFQAFGLCHVIQFPLRFRNVCTFALRFRSALALAGSPRRTASGSPPTLPWGKNPTRREARGISGSGENFNCPGGGCKEPRRRGPGLPCAQASADFHRDQRRRSVLFLLISAAVLREWQLWHRLWRLPGSVNTAQSPLWFRMWSTSVALVRMPC